jgi:hypothetical protein
MNPWPFVIAAYGLALVAVAGLLLGCWRAMRSNEARAQALRDELR